jgi:hypothetical protein
MQVDAVQADVVLRERIERRLLRAPVEAVAPVVDEVCEIGDVGARLPRLAGRLIGKARAGEEPASLS